MAGRHGNKGVVSRILPPEDMPFLADGTPLDIVLNPMGVPSRMNIGQVLEMHLGISAKRLGWKVMTPVFDGAKEKDITECIIRSGLYRDLLPSDDVYRDLSDVSDVRKNKFVYKIEKSVCPGSGISKVVMDDLSGLPKAKLLTEEEKKDTELLNKFISEGCLKTLTTKILYKEEDNEKTGEPGIVELTDEEKLSPEKISELKANGRLKLADGKSILYDGRTGQPFDHAATVGIMYYLKLHHLVDDKIHARATGPYSLVTQQPLGGKAQCGGQRFGEMEVWALEAYGAAYTLQEILTVKSDDVNGRTKTYEAIVKGQNIPTPGIPESFKVLVKELQALGLSVRVQDPDGEEIELSSLSETEIEPSKKQHSYFTEEEIGRSVAEQSELLANGFSEEGYDLDADDDASDYIDDEENYDNSDGDEEFDFDEGKGYEE